MCGIFGIYRQKKYNGEPISISRMETAIHQMKHRGPDAQHVKAINEHVAFGHLRLSIIDLSSTNDQPLSIDKGNFIITFNGEIYNYLELRKELIAKGIQFKTQGDTEVVLNAYKVWGPNCVKRFNGMWAFVIYDKVKNQIVCSRDRFGIKPFCYHFDKGEFIFSSEIKSILSYYPDFIKSNPQSIVNYITKSVAGQSENTWFKGIKRLKPAHNLIITGDSIVEERYWLYPVQTNYDLSFKSACEQYAELLYDSVKLRMRSDVSVGATLSSGLDSTSIVALVRKFHSAEFKTFTAFSKKNEFSKRKERYKKSENQDESVSVRKFARDFDLKAFVQQVDFVSYVDKLKNIIFHLESGHHSPSIIPLLSLIHI